jgi:hypothetical protein
MLEQYTDILSYDILSRCDAICFTSNGVVKKDGSLVMGAGVAKVFRDRFIGLDKRAGDAVREYGNVCRCVCRLPCLVCDGCILEGIDIVAFPTKHHWRDPSDIALIIKSAYELMQLVESNNWKLVALPRPGCSNGGLQWSEVKKVLDPILDDRVLIVSK